MFSDTHMLVTNFFFISKERKFFLVHLKVSYYSDFYNCYIKIQPRFLDIKSLMKTNPQKIFEMANKRTSMS